MFPEASPNSSDPNIDNPSDRTHHSTFFFSASELLLVGWAICFVASMAQSPTEKGRDFTQPVKRGKEIVGRKRRKNRTQTMTPDSEDGGEEQPYWSAAGRGLQEVPDGSILVVPPPVGDNKAKGTAFVVFWYSFDLWVSCLNTKLLLPKHGIQLRSVKRKTR